MILELMNVIVDFVLHLSFFMILNVAFALIIAFIMKRRLEIILSNQQDNDHELFEEIDHSLTVFKVLIILASILIFVFSLFSVFSWIEEMLPSLLNFFLYFLVLCICSGTHFLIYYVTLNKKIKQIAVILDEKDDRIVYAIEKNNIQLETFLNYCLAISIFYTSLHPILSEGLLSIPILIAQSVFIIKFCENYLIRIFSE